MRNVSHDCTHRDGNENKNAEKKLIINIDWIRAQSRWIDDFYFRFVSFWKWKCSTSFSAHFFSMCIARCATCPALKLHTTPEYTEWLFKLRLEWEQKKCKWAQGKNNDEKYWRLWPLIETYTIFVTEVKKKISSCTDEPKALLVSLDNSCAYSGSYCYKSNQSLGLFWEIILVSNASSQPRQKTTTEDGNVYCF